MRRSLSRLILPLTFPSIRRSSFPVTVPSKTMFGPRKATPGARVLSLRGRLFFGGGASLVKRAMRTSDDVADGRAETLRRADIVTKERVASRGVPFRRLVQILYRCEGSDGERALSIGLI